MLADDVDGEIGGGGSAFVVVGYNLLRCFLFVNFVNNCYYYLHVLARVDSLPVVC